MFNIRPVRNITCIALLLLAFAPNAQAEFYKIVIKKITPQSVSGDVIIQFKPGRKEDGFSGKAKAKLLGTALGTNRSLAVLLAAVSLGTEAVIELPAVPSNDVVQTIISTGITP
jgi:hypothetical protein